jgi:uncharacterized caspase-like protein
MKKEVKWLKYSFMFLDCCRTAATKVGEKITPSVEVNIKQLLISYSTASLKPTYDKDKNKETNSPYTTALLKYLPTPQKDILQVMKPVRAYVMNNTESKQQPADYNTFVDDFFFKQ